MTILQLPLKNSLLGRLSQQEILGLYANYGVCFYFAQVLMLATNAYHLQALAMGLILPGEGFLALSNNLNAIGFMPIAMAIASMCVFGGSLILWVGTGNAIAQILA